MYPLQKHSKLHIVSHMYQIFLVTGYESEHTSVLRHMICFCFSKSLRLGILPFSYSSSKLSCLSLFMQLKHRQCACYSNHTSAQNKAVIIKSVKSHLFVYDFGHCIKIRNGNNDKTKQQNMEGLKRSGLQSQWKH